MNCHHPKIAFSPPDITQVEIDKVIQVLQSGWITTGPQTKEFERQLSTYCGTERTVCLNSATAALELTLRLLGIGPGDEVITTAYTYTASASVVAHVGAKLVLVDVEPGTFHIDYDQLEQAINTRTKAVIPVDLGGVLCDYDRILGIVRRKQPLFQPHGLLQEAMGRVAVVADCAHGLGSSRAGRRAGSWADFTTFSFHAVKNLTTAEGGAVTWRSIDGVENDELYHQYMLLSLHGQSRDALQKMTTAAWEYDVLMPGYKCNMTDIMAAIGLGQLERYESLLAKRERLAALYREQLAGLPLLLPAAAAADERLNYHLFLVRIPGWDVERRNALIEHLAEKNIATNVHYKPLPMMTAYRKMGFSISTYPHAFAMYENEITLPLNTCMSDEDVVYVSDCLKELLG